MVRAVCRAHFRKLAVVGEPLVFADARRFAKERPVEMMPVAATVENAPTQGRPAQILDVTDKAVTGILVLRDLIVREGFVFKGCVLMEIFGQIVYFLQIANLGCIVLPQEVVEVGLGTVPQAAPGIVVTLMQVVSQLTIVSSGGGYAVTRPRACLAIRIGEANNARAPTVAKGGAPTEGMERRVIPMMDVKALFVPRLGRG